MQVLLEGFLLLNACMNAALLCITLRWCGRPVQAGRIALAAALGAVYAAGAYLPGMAFLRGIPAGALASAGMLYVAARWHSLRHFLNALLRLLSATFLLGGAVYAISQALGGIALTWRLGASAVVALVVALWGGTRRTHDARVKVRIDLGEHSALLEGLIDTGNLLRDPFNGLPVLIAPYAAVQALLPKSCDPQRLETLPPGFRLVNVTSTGGNRTLMCFRPGALSVQHGDKWRPVYAMVAIAPQMLPEGAVALVPTALMTV